MMDGFENTCLMKETVILILPNNWFICLCLILFNGKDLCQRFILCFNPCHFDGVNLSLLGFYLLVFDTKGKNRLYCISSPTVSNL